MPLPRHTIFQVRQLIKDGNESKIIEFCHNQMKIAKSLNAFITDTNLAPYCHLSKGENNNLLNIPFSMKDNYAVYGMRFTCASKILEDVEAIYDSTIVKKLRQCGALLFGKTNMDEFSMGSSSTNGFFGPVINPWTLVNQLQKDNASFNKVTTNKLASHCMDISTKNIHTHSNMKNSTQDNFYIAGGSSGGSAVSVATGSVFFSIGSDTGGSVRNPASYCGVVGFKPTYGSISRNGLVPLANNLDTPGIFARSVQDCATVYSHIAGVDENDLTTTPKTISSISNNLFTNMTNLSSPRKDTKTQIIRVGIPEEYLNHPKVCPEIVEKLLNIANSLQNYTTKIEDYHIDFNDLYKTDLPGSPELRKIEFDVKLLRKAFPHFNASIPCYTILTATEIQSNMARYDGIRYGIREKTMAETRTIGFNDIVKSRILAGNYFLSLRNYETHFQQACKVRRLISRDFNIAFNSTNQPDTQLPIDVLLTPVTLTTAPLYNDYVTLSDSELAEQDAFTVPANLAGIPAISIPIALSKQSNLPISIQVMSNHFTEPLLLTVAHILEKLVGNFPTLVLVKDTDKIV